MVGSIRDLDVAQMPLEYKTVLGVPLEECPDGSAWRSVLGVMCLVQAVLEECSGSWTLGSAWASRPTARLVRVNISGL